MTTTTDSPQSRLAASRKALVRQMSRYEDRQQGSSSTNSSNIDDQHFYDAQDNENTSTWQILSQAAMTWWKHHPVQVAVDVGRPFLNSYARDKPLQLLGIAAGAGAAAVMLKPWRLVSLTGLAVAALKSTKVSTALFSLLPLLPRASRKQATHKHNTQ